MEINPKSLQAAKEHFGFDEEGISIYLQDARTFVHRCGNSFDVVIVDLLFGDNTPDYLLTHEFFQDLRRCVRPQGVFVMNAFLDHKNDEPNRRLMVTMRSAFPRLYLYGFPDSNTFVVGTSGDAPGKIPVDAGMGPYQLVNFVRHWLSTKRVIGTQHAANDEPVTDEHNIFSVLFSEANMAFRKSATGILPPHVLVN